ncbi:hypothetical protein GGTG_08651 [Gaeumannomyces tritici R3-111a-1]|uniref:Uncharacterized protein n=1 Tax=Gaeumannomyces tritici (strain R3-111a-1) TaxID=644352 RepID=J3P562_GAET3|nr:hypothetical protein GGTG_08651 [Gaeumannomyces tritici R3-111a-1]EJT74813.1 hypothetical protein GGTG_08651 [Gaeumannomyces tritici R3-111a-1]
MLQLQKQPPATYKIKHIILKHGKRQKERQLFLLYLLKIYLIYFLNFKASPD